LTATVSRPYARAFVDWARDRDDVLCLSADLTGSCEIDDFRDTYPDRFVSCGMAEQNMMGVAAGLSREGFAPFVHTFGVFVTRRPYDQVAMSIGYPNLPVRLMGFLPGLTTPGGVTHQAIDDVALMRAIPNMTIVDTGDATEVETVLDAVDAVDGPTYARILRKDVPRLFDTPLEVGRARVLAQGDGGVCVISSGICTEEAIRAVAALRDAGAEVTHLHVSTLKPFDDPIVADAIAGSARGVVTLENHSVVGGLGSAVAEVIAESGLARPLRRIGLRDRYAHGASLPYLLERYGMTARHLVAEVADLLGEPLDVDLAERRAAEGPEREGAEDL
jgi:transketolase